MTCEVSKSAYGRGFGVGGEVVPVRQAAMSDRGKLVKMNKITKCTSLLIVVAICLSSLAQQQANNATEAFQKLQSLSGDWQGKDNQGNEVKSNFKVMISNTVVMETLDAAGMEEMLTLYSVDGNGISLLHYCPTNNQPHMRAIPASSNVKELVFSFLNAGNLSSIAVGHEHKMILDSKTRIMLPSVGHGRKMARTLR